MRAGLCDGGDAGRRLEGTVDKNRQRKPQSKIRYIVTAELRMVNVDKGISGGLRAEVEGMTENRTQFCILLSSSVHSLHSGSQETNSWINHLKQIKSNNDHDSGPNSKSKTQEELLTVL